MMLPLTPEQEAALQADLARPLRLADLDDLARRYGRACPTHDDALRFVSLSTRANALACGPDVLQFWLDARRGQYEGRPPVVLGGVTLTPEELDGMGAKMLRGKPAGGGGGGRGRGGRRRQIL